MVGDMLWKGGALYIVFVWLAGFLKPIAPERHECPTICFVICPGFGTGYRVGTVLISSKYVVGKVQSSSKRGVSET